MKKYSESKKLSFKKLEGISENTLTVHHDKLYEGYVKKWQEIQDKLVSADKTQAHATFSELRELKLEETFAANAVLLHEGYFGILGGDGEAKGEIIEALASEFGSFEGLLEEFKALGLAARGWVILAYDYNDGRLHNYLADQHNHGGVWGAAPILILDVYEHAYFMDHGSDRKTYIEFFFKNLDWSKISDKYLKLKKPH